MRTSSRTRSGFPVRELERGDAGIGFDDVVAPLFALLAERPADEALVVHDHDFLCGIGD